MIKRAIVFGLISLGGVWITAFLMDCLGFNDWKSFPVFFTGVICSVGFGVVAIYYFTLSIK